jgi:hypothetical protein
VAFLGLLVIDQSLPMTLGEYIWSLRYATRRRLKFAKYLARERSDANNHLWIGGVDVFSKQPSKALLLIIGAATTSTVQFLLNTIIGSTADNRVATTNHDNSFGSNRVCQEARKVLAR